MVEYKVGDRGVTRGGESVKCVDEREDDSFPLEWEIDSGRRYTTTRRGAVWPYVKCPGDIVRRIDDVPASHGPQRGPADLSRIRAQVAQTRRDLADAIDSLRTNLRVLDGVDAELNVEQSSSTSEGGA